MQLPINYWIALILSKSSRIPFIFRCFLIIVFFSYTALNIMPSNIVLAGNFETIDLAKGLISHWAVPGGNIDSSANSFPNQSSDQIKGQVNCEKTERGSALKFNGAGAVINKKMSSDFPAKAFTLAGWFKPENDKGLWGKWAYPDQRSFVVNLDRTYRVRFSISTDGTDSTVFSIRSKSRVNPLEWHHVTSVFYRDKMQLYINGKLESKRSLEGYPIHIGSAPFEIGKTGVRGYFKGCVRDIRLYDRLLNTTEIELIASNGFLVQVKNTLTNPNDLPAVAVFFERDLPDKKLKISIEKSGELYFRKTIASPSTNQVIDIVLKQDHPNGFFNANIEVLDNLTENYLFKENKQILIRKSGTPKDLLYFSFATPPFNEITEHHLNVLEKSPFTSMNSATVKAYDTSDPNVIDFNKAITIVKQCKKKIWPLVFLNRMVGSPKNLIYKKRNPYWDRNDISKTVFGKIMLMDIYDQTGSYSAFLDIFRKSLRLAKKTNAPGIFIDAEPYNCHHAAKIIDLSKVYALKPENIIERLKEIGKTLANITHEIYPGAFLYCYNTDFKVSHKGNHINTIGAEVGLNNEQHYMQSSAYIVLGILTQAKKENYNLKVIDGEIGEYTYPDLTYIKEKIINDSILVWKIKEIYPRHLFLSATIAPFLSFDQLPPRSWIRRRLTSYHEKGELKISDIKAFEPLFSYMLRSVDYIWIFGTGYADNKAGYNIFSPQINQAYNEVLGRSLEMLDRNKSKIKLNN